MADVLHTGSKLLTPTLTINTLRFYRVFASRTADGCNIGEQQSKRTQSAVEAGAAVEADAIEEQQRKRTLSGSC